jgi:hypothetical protein
VVAGSALLSLAVPTAGSARETAAFAPGGVRHSSKTSGFGFQTASSIFRLCCARSALQHFIYAEPKSCGFRQEQRPSRCRQNREIQRRVKPQYERHRRAEVLPLISAELCQSSTRKMHITFQSITRDGLLSRFLQMLFRRKGSG